MSFLRQFRSPDKCDMKIMAVRNYNGHFINQSGKYRKIQELINRTNH